MGLESIVGGAAKSMPWSGRAIGTGGLLSLGAVLVYSDLLPQLVFVVALSLPMFLWVYTKKHHGIPHQSAWLCLIISGLFVGLYRPETFSYPVLFSVEQLHANGHPFSLSVNTGKALAGYLILLWICAENYKRCAVPSVITIQGIALAGSSRREFNNRCIAVCVGVVLIILLAKFLLDLRWEPKYTHYVFYFLIVNLFVTCVSEEVFMRLLFQRHIVGLFQQKTLGHAISILVVTVIFAVTHVAQIGMAFWVYAFAGFCYALIYALTGRLGFAIAIHFALNITHFIFFEYPLVLT